MTVALRAFLLFAIGVSIAWAGIAPATAQQDQTRMVRFGVVDVEYIEREAAMNKDMNAQMGDLRKKLSEQVKQEESELRKASEDLQRQKVLLAPDAFEQEVRKFRQRELEFQKKIQERNNDFNRVRLFARNKFVGELNRALADIAKEHQFTLVLRKSQVLVVADFLDITPVVLAQVNKNVPKFAIPADVLKPAATSAAPKAADKKGAAPAKK
jgi:Skp family chaperone for outer membrane proteins